MQWPCNCSGDVVPSIEDDVYDIALVSHLRHQLVDTRWHVDPQSTTLALPPDQVELDHVMIDAITGTVDLGPLVVPVITR